MLVGTGLEADIVALLPLKTRDAVCQYDLVGVADMRLAGCIGDRGGDIIRFLTITIFILTHEPNSS